MNSALRVDRVAGTLLRRSVVAPLLAIVAAACWGVADAEPVPTTQAGEGIYRHGTLSDGRPVTGLLRGGTPLTRAQAACTTCHRRSGMGGSEGKTTVPPITGEALFNPREPAVAQVAWLAPSQSARRPAYDDATLARLIRDGIDAGGREIGDPMPRYALSDSELASLTAYLKSLTVETPPGITADTIHFATVVTDGVPEEKRRAMLDVMEAFFTAKNGGTRYETRRATRGPWTMKEYRAWRRWVLHVWELKGAAEGWPAQLERHYREQPVFALIGGVADGPWQEIDRFCETNRVPCLFPSTDLPSIDEDGFYTRYFSMGAALEARATARHLREQTPPGTVVQVFGSDAESIAAAGAFREALRGDPLHVLEERQWMPGEPGGEFWRDLLQGREGVQLVLWMREVDWESLRPWSGGLRQVVVSTTLLAQRPADVSPFAGRILAVQTSALPREREQKLTRVRAWLRLNGIPPGDERMQADAYFAATATADAVMNMWANLSRDYFLERVEDMLDSALTTSVYPRVTLGPGQRFASKGAHIVRLPVAGDGVGESWWVVP